MSADAIMLEAPTTKGKGKGKAKEVVALPDESLPSQNEISLAAARDAMQSIPSELAGFNPDLDQHLRQTLEALEDDAFVENNDEEGEADMEDLFGELLGEGERCEGERGEWEEWEFREEGAEGSGATETGSSPKDMDDLASRVAVFKKSQVHVPEALLDDGQAPDHSEGGDTIGRLPSLPPLSVIGGKRRRKGADSDASGFSMSSSSVFRNDGLRGLDAQFDRMELLYNSDEEILDSSEEHEARTSKDLTEDDSDEAPELLDTRDDLEGMMDEFLEKYELVGNKMRPVLGGITGAEKLATLRHALVDEADGDGGARARAIIKGGNISGTDNEDLIPEPYDIDEKYEQDRWDCETILTTYSNFENHPRLILARDQRPVPRIKLHPKTGLPAVAEDSSYDDAPVTRRTARHTISAREEVLGVTATESITRKTISRPRNESREDKKARKEAVRNEKQVRRAEKSAMREAFSAERRTQSKAAMATPKGARKL
ncbi:hypothetical protein FRC12_008355 [Ceratobasidium sp. 428]|nr:hypothetical protein FRC12_008355 [Ceratobasidium sp. 428]